MTFETSKHNMDIWELRRKLVCDLYKTTGSIQPAMEAADYFYRWILHGVTETESNHTKDHIMIRKD